MQTKPFLSPNKQSALRHFNYRVINSNSLCTDEVPSRVYHEDHVLEYIEYLKDYYTTQLAHPGSDGKWPNIQINRYIELSIANNCSFSRENAVQFSLSSIKEGIDDLVSRKETIGISGIASLRSDGTPCSGVLIVGAPGIGKTSLVRQLCLEWAQGKLLQHYEIVLLIQLRDRCLIEANSIGEIIDPDDHDNGMAIFREIKKRRGVKVLIIFDGYDEAPAELKKSVMVQRLLKGITLPLATVLITSRPAATTELVNDKRFEQKLEVLGFTKRNILQYAKQYFQENKSEETRQFRLYLKIHPHIFAMMYNPLHCAIVTEAYSFNLADGRPIHTMTDLYSNLTLSLLSRYSSVRYTSYGELPDSVADKFWRLVKLAYDCYHVKKFVFSDVPEDLIELGFFQSFPRMYSHMDASSCHSFLHLTLQEYLTALHVHASNLSSESTRYYAKNFDPFVHIFLSGLKKFLPQPMNFPTFANRYSPLFISSLFEIHSPHTIKSIVSSLGSKYLICWISDPFSSYSVGYVLAVTHDCPWHVNISNMTSDNVHCFRHGFEAGGGQCKNLTLHISLKSSNDYRCMLNLPHNVLENVIELFIKYDNLYANLNLLCRIWEKMPSLKVVQLGDLFTVVSGEIFLSKQNILSVFTLYSSLQNRDILMLFNFTIVERTFMRKATVWFFVLKSTDGDHRLVDYNEEGRHLNLRILCPHSLCPPAVWYETLSWFADMTFAELKYHAYQYWYNPYTQESLNVVNLTAHLSTITLTSTLQCPQPTASLLHHILHSNLLPCTATSLNLTHTSSTIIHHLQSAFSHNHQLICLKTDCSLSLRTLSSFTIFHFPMSSANKKILFPFFLFPFSPVET